MSQTKRSLPRRQFVKTSAASIIGASFVPKVLAAASEVSSIEELEFWEPAFSEHLDFPRPRYPRNIPKITDIEQILPLARRLSSETPRPGLSHLPGYGIPSGQRALVVSPSNFDRMVPDAITTALRERGVVVDQTILDIGRRESRMTRDGETGPAEREAQGTLDRLVNPRPRSPRKIWFIDVARQMQYNLVIEGSGGPLVFTTEGITDFIHQHILWPTRENFFLRAGTPSELRLAIDTATMKPLLEGGEVRITDPEGTDLTFNIFPELWSLVEERERRPRVFPGHLWGVPQMVIVPKSDARGVVAGTANHAGMYPRIEVHLENQQVVKVEGGGRYGEIWREVLERAKDIQWPEYPRRGFSWFIEAGIGSDPGCVPGWCWNNGEIRSSGIIHFGFGVGSQTEKFERFVGSTGLPGGHNHIHIRFATYEIKNSSGKVVRIIDKGRMTAFDDPEVRKVAAKYGDPDLLLRQAWIPAVPGINYPGNYQRDYAQDPVAWLKKWKSIVEQQVDRVLLYGTGVPSDPIRQT
ncbi:hypothetical protein MYX82_01080 [Acidobacteria bacterium AH-259-D05]|nr:hypothetical protein [Acidobacteria bacterium AH-259-D05]